jgi:hypothetical protein
MDTDDRMDQIPQEQEWKRWRILQQMQEGMRFGDFTPDEIEETKQAFGFGRQA